jgi:hypothetical protein
MSNPSTAINLHEIHQLVDWLFKEIAHNHSETVTLPYDFYHRPTELSRLFDPNQDVALDSYGSLTDEIEFLRNGVLAGQHDLSYMVGERLGYLFLALAVALSKLENSKQ